MCKPAIEELEWGRSIGLKGVNFPTPKIFMQPYNDPAWDPFFSACEDLDVTLCNHGGAGASGGTYPGAMSIAKFEISMMARICPMDQLVFGGTFERHPKLRLVLTESPGVWWRFVLKEMDSIYLTDTRSYGPSEKERVPRLPSEYAFPGVHRRQLPRALRGRRRDRTRLRRPRHLGLRLPALRGHVPVRRRGAERRAHDVGALRFHYAGLPIDDVKQFLAGNALRAYDLDGAALTKVAARINAPTYDDLNSATVDERPAHSGHLAFRTFGFWA